MRATTVILSLAVALAAAAPAGAQGRGRGQAKKATVPPGHLPPAGMCRIWINGVPPGHQPAPTDCETAVRNQPPNSRILWGDNTRRPGRGYPTRDENRRRDYPTRDDDRDDRRTRDRGRGTYDPSCVDNDRDGWCDYYPDVRSGTTSRTGGSTTPVDRGQYPSQMPAMTGAVLIKVGVRTADVRNWLGSGSVRAETVDGNGDGVPERATWYDRQGTVLQVWRDDDRNGRADSVEIYRNGQRVDVVR